MQLRWEKKGLLYSASRDGSWKDNSALTPTPFLLSERVIRVYASFRDAQGVGRIGFVDVDADDPSKVLGVSDAPVLDVGRKGSFDDSGVILGDVIRVGEEIRLYYVGFQRPKGVKFLAYSGLAISRDNGTTFARYQETPILGQHDEAKFIRAIHSVIFEDGIFKIWYATGNGWQEIDGVLKPQYDINYIESKDGLAIVGEGRKCIENDSSNQEYRIGRPRVYKQSDTYIMNYTYGTTDGRYSPGQATSKDGVVWERKDSLLGIELSNSGWDSVHLSYPALIGYADRTYMFYNGNSMGEDGFGWAERCY